MENQDAHRHPETTIPTSGPSVAAHDSDAEVAIGSEKTVTALKQRARDLARSVETVRQTTLDQSNQRIEALERKARDLAVYVETTRQETQVQSDW